MNINHIASQLQSTATLYAEILLCIAAASLLGWIVGLMMQRSRHKRQLAKSSEQWQTRYQALEASSRTDAEHLEEQLQTIANDMKTLQTKNRALTDSLKKNDSNTQKARAEALELNRQHSETNERLQRIVQQKDREIVELGNRLNLDPADHKQAYAPTSSKASATITRLAPELEESELNYADTIAITTTQFSSDAMDNQISAADVANGKINGSAPANLDNSLDDTSDLSDYGMEESTVAMDEEALAFAQRSFKRQRRD